LDRIDRDLGENIAPPSRPSGMEPDVTDRAAALLQPGSDRVGVGSDRWTKCHDSRDEVRMANSRTECHKAAECMTDEKRWLVCHADVDEATRDRVRVLVRPVSG
jgi:hypothetical protein